MPTPKELTGHFIHAYNQRDRVALRALLPPVLEYVRAGGGKLTTADEVLAQYERDWAVLSSSNVEVRDLVESGDGIIAEITIRATMGGGSLAVEGVVAHRWRGGRLIRYRLVLGSLAGRRCGGPTPRWSRKGLTYPAPDTILASAGSSSSVSGSTKLFRG